MNSTVNVYPPRDVDAPAVKRETKVSFRNLIELLKLPPPPPPPTSPSPTTTRFLSPPLHLTPPLLHSAFSPTLEGDTYPNSANNDMIQHPPVLPISAPNPSVIVPPDVPKPTRPNTLSININPCCRDVKEELTRLAEDQYVERPHANTHSDTYLFNRAIALCQQQSRDTIRALAEAKALIHEMSETTKRQLELARRRSSLRPDCGNFSPSYAHRKSVDRFDDATGVIKLAPSSVLVTELARLASDARGHTVEARDVHHLKIKINGRTYRCEISGQYNSC